MLSPSSAPTDKRPRLDYIDGLRGIAILLVLLTHTWTLYGAPAYPIHFGKIRFLLATIPAVGYIGVDLFLVLSGFCLAWPFMINPGYRDRYTIWQFWKRRVIRIVPAYYVSILFVFLVYIASVGLLKALPAHLTAGRTTTIADVPSINEIWSHLFLIHNLWPEHASTLNGSYWSLALEFQLYFLFPLLLELSMRWGVWRTLGTVLLIQLAFSVTLHVVTDSASLLPYEFVLQKSVFARVFEFCAGIAAAQVVAKHSGSSHWLTAEKGLLLGLAALGTGFALVNLTTRMDPLIDVLWATGFALLVCAGCKAGSVQHRFLSHKLLVRIGVMSYSIYLIHMPLVERFSYLTLLKFRPGSAFLIGIAIGAPLILLTGALFFRLVEEPALKLNRRPKAAA